LSAYFSQIWLTIDLQSSRSESPGCKIGFRFSRSCFSWSTGNSDFTAQCSNITTIRIGIRGRTSSFDADINGFEGGANYQLRRGEGGEGGERLSDETEFEGVSSEW